MPSKFKFAAPKSKAQAQEVPQGYIPNWMQHGAAGVVRVAGPWIGSKIGMGIGAAAGAPEAGVGAIPGALTGHVVGGGIGGALSEPIAELLEPGGTRNMSLKRTGLHSLLAGGLGAVPGSWMGSSKTGSAAIRGGALGYAGTAGSKLAEGDTLNEALNPLNSTKRWSPWEVALGPVLGAGLNVGLNRYFGHGSVKSPPEPEKPVFHVETTAQPGGNVLGGGKITTGRGGKTKLSGAKPTPVEAIRPITGTGETLDIALPTPETPRTEHIYDPATGQPTPITVGDQTRYPYVGGPAEASGRVAKIVAKEKTAAAKATEKTQVQDARNEAARNKYTRKIEVARAQADAEDAKRAEAAIAQSEAERQAQAIEDIRTKATEKSDPTVLTETVTGPGLHGGTSKGTFREQVPEPPADGGGGDGAPLGPAKPFTSELIPAKENIELTIYRSHEKAKDLANAYGGTAAGMDVQKTEGGWRVRFPRELPPEGGINPPDEPVGGVPVEPPSPNPLPNGGSHGEMPPSLDKARIAAKKYRNRAEANAIAKETGGTVKQAGPRNYRVIFAEEVNPFVPEPEVPQGPPPVETTPTEPEPFKPAQPLVPETAPAAPELDMSTSARAKRAGLTSQEFGRYMDLQPYQGRPRLTPEEWEEFKVLKGRIEGGPAQAPQAPVEPPPPIQGTGKADKFAETQGGADELDAIMDQIHGEGSTPRINPEGHGTIPSEPPTGPQAAPPQTPESIEEAKLAAAIEKVKADSDFKKNVLAKQVRKGMRIAPKPVPTEAEPSIPGLEGVSGTENPTPPVADLPQQGLSLTPPPVKPPKAGNLPLAPEGLGGKARNITTGKTPAEDLLADTAQTAVEPPKVEPAAPIRMFKSPLEAAGEGYGDIKKAKLAGEKVPEEGRRVAGQAAQRLKKEADAVAPKVEPTPVETGPTSDDLTKLSPEDQSKALADIVEKFKNEKGAIDPMLLTRIGLGTAGALAGAVATPDDPLTGALLGLGVGAFAPSVARALMTRIAQGKVSPQNTEKVASKIKENVDTFFRMMPDYQRFAYLSHPINLPMNIWVGPYGSSVMAAIEHAAAGDPRGQIALKMLTPANFMRRFKANLAEAGVRVSESNERTEGLLGQAGPQWWRDLAQKPGKMMTQGDLAARDILKEAGFSEEEARRITLTSEPYTPTGKMISAAKKGAQTEGGKKGWFTNMALPFYRTATNQLEQGLERTPFVGFWLQKYAKDVPDPIRMQIVQQAIGGGVGAASMMMGAFTPKEDSKYVLKFINNFGGQYGAIASTSFLVGQAMAAGKSGMGSLTQQVSRGDIVPLPTTEPMVNWLQDARYMLGEKVKPKFPLPIPGIIDPNSGASVFSVAGLLTKGAEDLAGTRPQNRGPRAPAPPAGGPPKFKFTPPKPRKQK